MSTRIAASLSLDTTGFQTALARSEQEGSTFAAKMRQKGVGLFSGKSARDSADAFGFGPQIAAEEKLATVRKQNAFARLSDDQKIVVLEQEITAAKSASAAIDSTNVEKLQIELQIEEKLVQLERLRLSAASSRAAVEQEAAVALAAEQAALDARRAKATRVFFGLPPAGSSSGGGGNARGERSDLSKVLNRGFGAGEFIKAGLGFIGFASVGMIVGKAMEHIEDRAAKAAERVKQLVEEMAGLNAAAAKLANFGKSSSTQLVDLQKEQRLRVLKNRYASYDSPEERQIGQTRFQKESLENDLAQRELKKKIYEEARDKLAAIQTAERAVSAEQYKRYYESLDNQQKLNEQIKQQARYEAQAQLHQNNALASARFQLAAEESKTEQARLQLAILAEKEALAEKELAILEKQQAKADELRSTYEKAQKSFNDARTAVDVAKSDAIAFTPAELTRTASGRRDTTATGLKAASILRDEAMARKLKRSGGTVERYDAKYGGRFQADAEFFQTRANDNRRGFDPLKSSEQTPFAEAEQALSTAAADLSQAAADLKNVEVTIDTR